MHNAKCPPARTFAAAAARIKKREDQLRGTAGDPRARVAKCIEVDGEISENFYVSLTVHHDVNQLL
jgi:hypothetical protein